MLTKTYYGYCKQTRYFNGVVVAHLDQLDGGYYCQENSTEHAPPELEGLHTGKGYYLAADNETWVLGTDYSQSTLYDKQTALECHYTLEPGRGIPANLTTIAPPECDDGYYPEWDESTHCWRVGYDMSGVEYHIGDTSGRLVEPWDKLPEGAEIGPPPSVIIARRFEAKAAKINEVSGHISALLSILEYCTNSEQSIRHRELLAKYKEVMLEVVNMDTEDLTKDFVLPDNPTL